MKKEPLLTVGAITAAAAAILALLVAFGVPVTDEQQTAILGVVAVLAPAAVALIARHFVTPVASGAVEAERAARDEDGNPIFSE